MTVVKSREKRSNIVLPFDAGAVEVLVIDHIEKPSAN